MPNFFVISSQLFFLFDYLLYFCREIAIMSMEKPLLSIITPVYNVEAYLDRCVQSVLSQSYREIELILIDDGSTDGSASLCDEWEAKDSRVVVVHQANAGVSAARNAGLKIAQGDYLTFVDPDDFLAPDTYFVNMAYLQSHQEVDMLQYPYCNYIINILTATILMMMRLLIIIVLRRLYCLGQKIYSRTGGRGVRWNM